MKWLNWSKQFSSAGKMWASDHRLYNDSLTVDLMITDGRDEWMQFFFLLTWKGLKKVELMLKVLDSEAAECKCS